MTEHKISNVRFDGKFTVTYDIGPDSESAFRVEPELGRLIAAAPALLEAAELTIEWLDNQGKQPNYRASTIRERLEAAIAAAKGESQ